MDIDRGFVDRLYESSDRNPKIVYIGIDDWLYGGQGTRRSPGD